jgi:hypothetical protein
MRSAVKIAVALALCPAAVALASCGEEDAQLLPGETAREITANLDSVRELSDEGDCIGAENAAEQVAEQIEGLQGVDSRLKRALEKGAERLNEVIAECEEASEEPAPTSVPEEGEEEEREREREEKAREKEEKAREKEEEKREKEEPSKAAPPSATGEPPSPPNGEGEGVENGQGPPPAEGETGPSGGVSPGNPVTGGE